MEGKPTFDRGQILAALRDANVEVVDDVPIEAFGDSAEMAAELGVLVRDGKKTATAALVWEFEHEQEPLPKVGDREVTIDWHGNLLALIEMSEIRIVGFRDVEAEFARDEGEGDLSLEFWRRAHWDFFERVCKKIGRQPAETMPILCQRFRLVYPRVGEVAAMPPM